MKEFNIPFYKYKSLIPVVRFNIGDRNAFAVIDTGSDVSVLDMDTAKALKGKIKLKKTEDKVSVVGISGSDYNVPRILASCDLAFTDKDGNSLTKPTRFMVQPLTHLSNHMRNFWKEDITVDALIGTDMLNEWKSKVNFRKKTLSIYDDLSD